MDYVHARSQILSDREVSAAFGVFICLPAGRQIRRFGVQLGRGVFLARAWVLRAKPPRHRRGEWG